MDYAEKLRDPRWQKRRLQVLERAGWKCQSCGREDKTLNIHHLYYLGEPWDVPPSDLECLCEDCHTLRKTLNDYIASRIRLIPTRQIKMMAEFFSAFESTGRYGSATAG